MINTQLLNISILNCISVPVLIFCVVFVIILLIIHRMKNTNNHLNYFYSKTFMTCIQCMPSINFYNTKLGISKLSNFFNHFILYKKYNVNFQSYLHTLGLNYNKNVYLLITKHLGKGNSMVVREYNTHNTFNLICFTTKGVLLVPLKKQAVSSQNAPTINYFSYQYKHYFIKLSDINSLSTYHNVTNKKNNIEIDTKNKSIKGHLIPHHHNQDIIKSLKNLKEYKSLFK